MRPRPPSPSVSPWVLLVVLVVPLPVLLTACSGATGPRVRGAADATPEVRPASRPARGAAGAADTPPTSLSPAVSPGDARGPGRFVARGDARSFYSAGGGRLWFYLNAYYWVRKGLEPRVHPSDLWVKTDVIARFVDLKRWPDGAAVEGPPPKFTHEYWQVGASGRTVKLDNHKDYVRLADGFAAGTLVVEVTLALGRLHEHVADGTLRQPRTPYVLDARDYGADRGVGPDAHRFEPLQDEPVSVWSYHVPWSSLPGPMTRSVWEGLSPPKWQLVATRPPPHAGPRVAGAPAAPVVTPGDRPLAPSPIDPDPDQRDP